MNIRLPSPIRNTVKEPIPEIELLLLCISTNVEPELSKNIHELIEQNIDWELLLNIAAQRAVLPMLYKKLSTVCPSLVPQPILLALQAQFRMNSLRVLHLTSELLKVIEILENEGIIVVPFKGPVLAKVAYGDLSLRVFSDLDVFVQEQDYFKPKYLLASNGYETEAHQFLTEQQEISYRKLFGEYPMYRREHGVCVDIHEKLIKFDSVISSSKLNRFWSRLAQIKLGEKPVWSFQLEDLLLYLCLNGIKDYWTSLRSVCDIAELICSHPEINWKFLISEAEDLGVARILRLGLLIANQLLNLHLPNEVQNKIQSDLRAKCLADLVCERFKGQADPCTISPIEKLSLHINSMDCLRDQVLYCLRILTRSTWYLFMLNSRDKTFISLPPTLHWVYYLVRPIRLIKAHGLNIFRLVFL